MSVLERGEGRRRRRLKTECPKGLEQNFANYIGRYRCKLLGKSISIYLEAQPQHKLADNR